MRARGRATMDKLYTRWSLQDRGRYGRAGCSRGRPSSLPRSGSPITVRGSLPTTAFAASLRHAHEQPFQVATLDGLEAEAGEL